MLTGILTMSALAVDIGAAYSERRHDQNTADVAVMSGAVEAVLGGGIIDKVVAEVRDKVDTTLGREVSPDEWLACRDDERLHFTARDLATANPVIAPVTDCISFSRTFEEVRVRLPSQTALGVFGPALGFGEIEVSAGANASIESATGGLPFVALSTATKGDFVCLRTSSAKVPLPLANGNGPGKPATFPGPTDPSARPDPCHAKEFDTLAENFGTLKPWRYETCTQQNDDVEVAIAIGLDHPMGIFPNGYDPSLPKGPDGNVLPEYQVRQDGAPYTGTNRCRSAFPNTFELDEGLNESGLSCALIKHELELCNGVTPRLQSGKYSTKQAFTLMDYDVFDNVPPWQFMRDGSVLSSEGSPQSCVDVANSRTSTAGPTEPGYWDHYDRFDSLIQCLKEWGQPRSDDPTDGTYPRNVLFEDELGESARFGFVPQVHETSLAHIDWVHVEGFLPIFMYRLYVQDPTTPTMCDPADPRAADLKVHDAGQGHSCAKKNQTIDRLASIIFACDMVPDSLCNKSSGEPNYAGKDIYEFRLVK